MQAFNSEPIRATIFFFLNKIIFEPEGIMQMFLCKHLSVQSHESIKINIVEIFAYYTQYAYCIKRKSSILAFFFWTYTQP